jgi:hypothetical protein
LYLDRELEKLKREAGTMATGGDEPPTAPVRQPLAEQSARVMSPATAAPAAVDHSYAIAELREQLEAVRNEVASLRKDLDDLWSNFR